MFTSTTCVRNVMSTIGAIRTSPVMYARQGGLFQAIFPQWNGKSSQTSSDSPHTGNNDEITTIHNKTPSYSSSAVTTSKTAHKSKVTLAESSTPTSSDVNSFLYTIPPQRRVARWFFPGFTDQEKRAGKKTTSTQSQEEGTKNSKNKNNTSVMKSNTVANTPTSGSQDVVEKEHRQKENATNNPTRIELKVSEQHSTRGGAAIGGTQPVRGLSDHHLPSAFREYVERRNQHLKAILMNALGSDFAKAGVDNNGLRMSFSAAASEAAKRAIGLRRVSPKLLISCVAGPDNVWDWVDITAHPTAALDEYRNALSEVLLDLGAHETLVSDALEPMLLPQATVIRGCHCLVVRYAVDVASTSMESFQDLTNRFTILVTDTRVVTIHRTHCAFVENLKRNWSQVTGKRGSQGRIHLLSLLVKESVDTFNTALTRSLVEFDRYEASLFSPEGQRSTLAREIYHIKRRASVYARTLNLIGDAYTHVCSALPILPTNVQFQDVQQDIAHVRSISEELNANADSVLQLLFQLSSYQLNELMRVLTIFSAFFIPLSFIASIYGMNFTHLPLLEDSYGHVYCVAFMLVVGGGLVMWFKLKRFM